MLLLFDHNELWLFFILPWIIVSNMLKNWCFWTVVLEKTLQSPLESKEIKPVNPKGNQLWVFTGKTDAKVEAPILWPPDAKSRLTGKDPDARKDWKQEKGMTEDKMVEWHHWFYGCEFEQTLGDSERQGSLMCCSPRGDSQTRLSDWTTTNACLYYYLEIILKARTISHSLLWFPQILSITLSNICNRCAYTFV